MLEEVLNEESFTKYPSALEIMGTWLGGCKSKDSENIPIYSPNYSNIYPNIPIIVQTVTLHHWVN